jgi:oligopeptide/dipeptide ABC transporter ATP-binding protein
MSLLEVENLNLSVTSNRTKVPILRNVSINVEKAEVVAIVGETGSGKTLTAKAVMGILPKNSIIDSGHAFYEGVDILTSSAEANKVRKKIAMVFQNPMSSLNQLFKIKDQMSDVLNWSGVDKSQMTKETRIDKIISTMEQVKLGQNVLDMYPFQLSGGMRQRVMIAMSLLREPDLLIADEPTTALDVTTQREILNLLQELAAKNKMSLLLITHNLGIAFETAERTYVFYAGRVVEEGITSSLFRNPLHPYTRGLIDSIPSLDRSRAMEGIRGEISQDDRSTESCCFNRRCPIAIEICTKEEPQLEELESRHRVACFVASQKAKQTK